MILRARSQRLEVKLSVDDLCTVFSGIVQVKRFHVDNLKIGHIFVRDINKEPVAGVTVVVISSLTQRLQLRLTAKLVQTLARRNCLTACGGQDVRGFYFAYQLPAFAKRRADSQRGWI